jgi:hypothetical protein
MENRILRTVRYSLFSGTLRLWVVVLCALPLSRAWAGNITAVWANEGGDKVTQDELRVTRQVENQTGKVINRAWDGRTIHLFGAHNEEVSFNLVLEAPFSPASNVTVTFDTLTGPGGAAIHSTPTTGSGVFNWTNRPIELFLARYLQINGLSWLEYTEGYDPTVPVRFKQTNGSGGWTARPDHGKFYPDPLVPLEVAQPFTIAASQNQSIWSDIYIPKSVPAGTYTGNVIVQESGATSWTIPVQLTVYNFALPDVPTAKTFMVGGDDGTIMDYWFGRRDIYGGPDLVRTWLIADRFWQVFHRHKIDLVGDNACNNTELDPNCPTGWSCTPCASSIPRLNGALFTAAHGYDGPGVGQGVGVYSINTYGSPKDMYFTSNANMYLYLDEWVTWFKQNSPQTQFWLYTCDEPLGNPNCSPSDIEAFIQRIHANPGPGSQMPTLSTIDPVVAKEQIPSLDIPVVPAGDRRCPGGAESCDFLNVQEQTAAYYRNTPGKHFFAYNTHRPSTGSDATEDDGTALRTIGWSQFKKNVERWFNWFTMPGGGVDYFNQAVTFGQCSPDASVGQANCANGDGQLVYPGTQIHSPANSYNIDGPIATIRLKEWRRGIQDADYLALASKANSQATQAIVNKMIPAVMWEAPPGLNSVWGTGPISWSVDPDDWENARAQLAQIILGNTLTATPTLSVSPVVLNFKVAEGGAAPAPQTVNVRDTGGAGLSWTGTAPTSSWLQWPALGGTMAAGDSQPLSISVDNTGLTKGSYHDSVTLTAPGADNSPEAVDVNLTIAAAGSGNLLATGYEVAFSTIAGGGLLPAQTISLTNTGQNPMGFTFSTFGTGPNWLTVTPGQTLLNANQQTTITVTANAHNVSPGSYTQAIVFNAPDALNNPIIVWADLNVRSLRSGSASSAFTHSLHVFPNPWRLDKHNGTSMTFDQAAVNSDIKIFTVSGHLVTTILANASGVATWDPQKSRAASGVYLYLGTSNQGGSAHGKFAVIH